MKIKWIVLTIVAGFILTLVLAEPSPAPDYGRNYGFIKDNYTQPPITYITKDVPLVLTEEQKKDFEKVLEGNKLFHELSKTDQGIFDVVVAKANQNLQIELETNKFSNISVRDWFAGQALSGMVAHAYSNDKIGIDAYHIADQMMKERNK